MHYKNDQISVTDLNGRFKGRLNFSILISWVLTVDGEFRVGDEFSLPFDYFQKFEPNSEFNYHDTCDPETIYRLILTCLEGESAVIRIQKIFKEQGDMWLYENSITYGTDYGIIDFVGVHREPYLKLGRHLKCGQADSKK